MRFDPVELAAEITAVFVSHNFLLAAELPALILSVHAAVKGFSGLDEIAAAVTAPPVPAASIRQSVTADYLICLEDGKQFKSLRRHLALLGMTPEQYRMKWGLPPTYPMVASNYAARRSEMAKSAGFGRVRRKTVVTITANVAKSPAKPITALSPANAKRKPGRPRKTPT